MLSIDELLALVESEGVVSARTTLHEAVLNPAFRHRNMEDEINILGYRLLADQRTDDAIVVMQLNVDAYPDSWNAYDSLGDAYEAPGNPEEALAQFQKSLVLNPTSLPYSRRWSDSGTRWRELLQPRTDGGGLQSRETP